MSRVKPHDEGIMEIRAPWGGSQGEARFPQMPENEGFTLLKIYQKFSFTARRIVQAEFLKMEQIIQDRVVREIIVSLKAN